MNRLAPFAFALAVAGCATVSDARFTVNDVKKGEGKALDVRTGEHWYNRLLASPHRLVIYRKEDGSLEVIPEQSNPDALTELSGPLGTVASHTVATVPLAP
jgi:hypothetical protein